MTLTTKSALPGVLFGCVRLSGHSELDLSFLKLDACDRFNHTAGFDSNRPKPFDYWHGSIKSEIAKQIVPTKNTTFIGYKIGAVVDSTSPINKVIHSILSMRQQDLEREIAESTFLEKIFYVVYPKIDNRIALSLDITSSKSQFVIVSKDVTVYFTSFYEVDERSSVRASYLAWCTDEGFEALLRANYPERFFFFRHRPLLNGVAVIQSRYLRTKYVRWLEVLKDQLQVFNALDSFLGRKTCSQGNEALPVNNTVDTVDAMSSNNEEIQS